MSVALDQTEQALVSAKKKHVRPFYYDATSRTEKTISEDMEAFLILMPSAVKQQTVTWLKQASNITSESKDRDELLSLAIDLETADAEAYYADIQTVMGAFNDWRKQFDVGKFSGVSEVGLVLSDLQKAMGEKAFLDDVLFHLKTFSSLMKTRQDFVKVTDDQKKELESWVQVFSRY